MPQDKHEKTRNAPIMGIILLFLGSLFLLETMGILPWSLWHTLSRYWPVILIILGLRLIMHRNNPWLVSLLILAILILCLTLAMRQQGITLSAEKVAMPCDFCRLIPQNIPFYHNLVV
jgi:hypothetical protein